MFVQELIFPGKFPIFKRTTYVSIRGKKIRHLCK